MVPASCRGTLTIVLAQKNVTPSSTDTGLTYRCTIHWCETSHLKPQLSTLMYLVSNPKNFVALVPKTSENFKNFYPCFINKWSLRWHTLGWLAFICVLAGLCVAWAGVTSLSVSSAPCGCHGIHECSVLYLLLDLKNGFQQILCLLKIIS